MMEVSRRPLVRRPHYSTQAGTLEPPSPLGGLWELKCSTAAQPAVTGAPAPSWHPRAALRTADRGSR